MIHVKNIIACNRNLPLSILTLLNGRGDENRGRADTEVEKP